MTIQIRAIDVVPDDDRRRGPRESPCLDIVKAASAAPTKTVEVSSDDKPELLRIYKALIAWRTRHKETPIGIKKGKDAIYVWVIEG